MRKSVLIGLVILIIVASARGTEAQPLRIDNVEPRVAERGEVIVVYGDLGAREEGMVIRLARVVNRQAQVFYPAVRNWTQNRVEVLVPGDLPADRYLVTVVYASRPSWHSNNFIITILPPSPPAVVAGGDNPVGVLPNRCMTRERDRNYESRDGEEVSRGGLYSNCETMRTINGANPRQVMPGDSITISGDFGNRRPNQYVALANFYEVESENSGTRERRLRVSHVLQIVAWSPYHLTVRINDGVIPNDYGLLILNRLSRNVVPGVFEQGSNVFQIRVRPHD